MGPVFNIPVNMQFLLSASLLAAASAYYPLVTFPNGAVTPFDVTNPVGTYSQAGIPLHHIGKREAQYPLVTFPNGAVTPFDVNNPVGTYSQAGIPDGVIAYGKRSAEPQLVAFPNGAVTPFDHANPVGGIFHYGKRSAQLPVNLVVGHGVAAVANPYFGYSGLGAVVPVVAPFTAHPNGALVPKEPAEVEEARAEHLAAHAA